MHKYCHVLAVNPQAWGGGGGHWNYVTLHVPTAHSRMLTHYTLMLLHGAKHRTSHKGNALNFITTKGIHKIFAKENNISWWCSHVIQVYRHTLGTVFSFLRLDHDDRGHMYPHIIDIVLLLVYYFCSLFLCECTFFLYCIV